MVDSSMFRSIGFGLKNVDNTQKGQPAKILVAGGQGYNAFAELKKYNTVSNCINDIRGDIWSALEKAQKADGLIGKTANTAVDAFNTISKETKIFSYAGEALGFAGKHINPLICVSACVDVALADDKEKTFVENSMGLGAMFATESFMKKHLSDVVKIKGVDKIAASVMKAVEHTKYGKYVPAIVHGATFIVGSCLAYATGQKCGNALMGGDTKNA